MEQYFKSILHNTSKIKGSSSGVTMNVISTFNGFGIPQLKSFMERKRVTCLDLRTYLGDSAAKVMKSLPNEFIAAAEKFELIADAAAESIENIYENPMVILADYVDVGEIYYLSAIILALKERIKNINWYHLNFSGDAMFELLREEQKNRPDYDLPNKLIELLSTLYRKREQLDKHCITINKKSMKSYLMYFKKWFDDEQSLDSAVTKLFYQFESGDTNDSNNNIYIHFTINSELYVKYVDIDMSDIDKLDDAFSSIDLA